MPHLTLQDHTQLYIKDWGKGRPVILLHGWPLSADSWDDQAFALANAGFRVIAYDRRGFGRSSQPWDGYDYNTLSDDLAAVVQYAASDKVAVVGFSMGGGEVARYMTRHAGRNVTQAGLISSVVPYMPKMPDNPQGMDLAFFEKMTQQIMEDRPKFFAGFFKGFFGVGVISHPVSSEVVHAAWTVAMQAGLKPTLECARSFFTTDFRPDLAAFKVPTLIIHGTADTTVPIDAAGRAAAKGIREAKLIEYDGAPHGLFATHKEQFTRDLLGFLSR